MTDYRNQGFSSQREKIAFGLLGLQESGVKSIHVTGVTHSGWIRLYVKGDRISVPSILSKFQGKELDTLEAVVDAVSSPRKPWKDPCGD